MRRPRLLLTKTTMLVWGSQIAFLNPALALVLSESFGAGEAQIGLALALYNGSGFIASLVIPAYADRRGTYLTLMLVCGLLTMGLATVLAVASDLPWALVALVVLGGPATVGTSLFFASLRTDGISRADFLNVRAMLSVAWVAGPPVALLLVAAFGARSVPIAIGIVATASIVLVAILRRRPAHTAHVEPDTDRGRIPYGRVVALMVAFIGLQATNVVITSTIALFVVENLALDPVWGGVALGVAALLEIPAFTLLGRLSDRFGSFTLLTAGCIAGAAFYILMAIVQEPILLIGAQVLNAASLAAVSGIGLILFQDLVPRPGFASGLFVNTRLIGSILAGGIVALAATGMGLRGSFLVCAGITVGAVVVIAGIGLIGRRSLAQEVQG